MSQLLGSLADNLRRLQILDPFPEKHSLRIGLTIVIVHVISSLSDTPIYTIPKYIRTRYYNNAVAGKPLAKNLGNPLAKITNKMRPGEKEV